MKTKTSPRRRLYSYYVVAYFGPSAEEGIPMAWTVRAPNLTAAKRKSRRMGHGDRPVVTAQALRKIFAASY